MSNCFWSFYDDAWHPACADDAAFSLDGGPEASRFFFCPVCGCRITIEPTVGDVEEARIHRSFARLLDMVKNSPTRQAGNLMVNPALPPI